MKLTEVFAQLTYGELSQISMGGGEAGEINENNYEAVLSHINLGLTALYKRFPLKESRLTVELQPGRFTYPLAILYAESNTRSKEPVKYIKDVGNPFTGDILKIEGVFTAAGKEFPLNDAGNVYSITTPSMAVLKIPAAIVANDGNTPEEFKTTTLEVVYRANHPVVSTEGNFMPETYELELPYSHLEPLLLYVASRVNNPIGMVNEFNAGNNYSAKYEMACQAIETANIRVDQGAQHDRLRSKGWV